MLPLVVYSEAIAARNRHAESGKVISTNLVRCRLFRLAPVADRDLRYTQGNERHKIGEDLMLAAQPFEHSLGKRRIVKAGLRRVTRLLGVVQENKFLRISLPAYSAAGQRSSR